VSTALRGNLVPRLAAALLVCVAAGNRWALCALAHSRDASGLSRADRAAEVRRLAYGIYTYDLKTEAAALLLLRL
jgi:hypothetical protein